MLVDIDGKKYSLRQLRCYLTSDGIQFIGCLETACAGFRDPKDADIVLSEILTLASEEMVRLIREEPKLLRKEITSQDIFLPSLDLDYKWNKPLLVRDDEPAVDYIDFFLYAIFFRNMTVIKKARGYTDNMKLLEDILRFALFLFTVSFTDRQKGIRLT